jgi:WD40 repeat protein
MNGCGDAFVWELATGKLLHRFPGNPNCRGHTGVALSPDGKTLATCRRDDIVLWDPTSGRERGRLQQPSANAVAFSPDGKVLASADGRNPEISLWDVATGTEIRRIPRSASAVVSATRLAFSHDGANLTVGTMADPNIEVRDATTGKQRHVRACLPPYYPLVLSPISDLLAIAGQAGNVGLWDARADKLVRTLETGAKVAKPGAFSADGKILLMREMDAKLGDRAGLWDVSTGKRLRLLEKGIAAAPWFVAAFSRDGKTLITNGGRKRGESDSSIYLWDAASGEERGPALDQPRSVACLTLAPDGQTLAYARDLDVQLLDAVTGRAIGRLPHGPEGVVALAFSPDGRKLASCERDGAIRLWDVHARRLLLRKHLADTQHKRAWASTLAYAPNGETFAAAGTADTQANGSSAFVWICDAATGRELRRFVLDWKTEGWSPIMGLAFLNEGAHLAAASRTHETGSRVTVWEMATGRRVSYLMNGLNWAGGGDEQPRAEVWEINRLEPNVVASPDGRLLARNGQSKVVSVWETTTGKRRCSLVGHEEAIFRVAFAPDGRTLASASADETIRLWDLATGKELRRLTGHRGIINSLVFSADGTTLISAGNDTTILFWDVAAVTRRERPRERLADADWNSLWTDLAGTDAVRAHRAIARLTCAREVTVALQGRMRPAARVEAAAIAQLVRDLDSPEFAVRSKATDTLEQLGERSEAALRQALENQPSPEARRRIEDLLSQQGRLSGKRLRAVRAVEVLEHIATPQARQLLQKLAEGAPEARLTREARASLGRLNRQISRR